MKKILSIICALSLLPTFYVSAEEVKTQIGPVNRVGLPNDYALTTPDENIFKIEGISGEFILLDDEDGFFVLTKDVFGTRAFDPDDTQKFDIEDPNNVAYWLNNDFLKNGNSGKKLPDEIIRYIDHEREWFTEGGFQQGNCPEDYTVKCGVVLLSQLEWQKYDEVFGVLDDIPPYGWWLRTGRGIGGGKNVVLAGKTGDGRIGETFGDVSSNAVRNYIRPAFYLKDEFFKEVRLEKIGLNVGTKLSKHFSYTDFQGEGTLGYSDTMLRNAGFEIPFEIYDGDDVIGENVLHNEYNYNLEGESSEEKIILRKAQSIKSVFPVNSSLSYEIVLDMGTENVSTGNGAVLYADYYDLDGKTKVAPRTELIALGGTREPEAYVMNTVDIPDEAYFVLFTLEFKEGVTGAVNFNELSMRLISPKVEFTTDWGTLNIINPKSDKFGVKVSYETTLPKTFTAGYRIVYDADGYVFEGEEKKLFMDMDGVIDATVEMKNMRRGNGKLELYVKYGNSVVKSSKYTITVLEKYDWSKDNGLIRHGICVHPDQYFGSNKTIADAIYDAGFNLNRGDASWYNFEAEEKGKYNFTKWDNAKVEMEKRNNKYVPILTYSSTLYTPGNTRSGIISNEMMDAFAKFAQAVVLHYPDVDTVELWNEPNNNGFWGPNGMNNPNDYANFVKIVSRAIKEVRPEVTVVAGAIDVSKNGPGWSREIFDYGIYPYIDAFSTHPYYHTAVNDVAFLPKLKQYTDIIEDYGGWKDIWLTEIGWTTYQKYELEETQAEEMVKILTHSDYSEVMSTLFNITAGAEDFGLIDLDFGYRVKPNYNSTTTYYVQTQNAQFLTKPDLNPDCHSFLYRKDNKPLIVSWCHTGEETTLEFETDVKVYDMYGNFEYEGRSVKQTQSPKYIYIDDSSYMYNTLKSKTVSRFNDFIKRYENVLNDEIISSINKNNEVISNSSGLDVTAVDLVYDVGIEMIEKFGADINKAENSNMMSEYHKCAKEVADLYSLSGAEFEDISEVSVTEADNLYQSLMEESADTKRFSYELVRHSKKHLNLAKQISVAPNVQSGMAAANDAVARNLSKWAMLAMNTEQSENIGISFQAVPGIVEAYEKVPSNQNIYVYNDNNVDKKGNLKILSPKGDVLCETGEITIPAKGKYDAELLMNLESVGFGNHDFVISFEGDENATMPIKAHVNPRIEVKLENSEKTVEELGAVTLSLTNKISETMKGHVKVTPPKGWTVSGEAEFEIVPGEEKKIEIPVTAKERMAFNCYMFNVEVFDHKGNIISEKLLPLDFSVIIKTEKELSIEDFNGDISDWSNAYPTYINAPDAPENAEDWKDSDVAARVFTKWDDNYFYLLADIYDNIQNQLKHESTIYDGDSLQLAFDTLNDKTVMSYGTDDYEYGFALTLTGEESYSWQVATGKDAGAKPSEWSRILRDEENKNTRYLIKIPKADLEPMEFTEGSVIGFNLVVNDANLIGNRESWHEITYGIGMKKDPSSYRNWELKAFEEITDNGLADVSAIFATKMGDVNVFSDIGGHWAEDTIKEVYKKGLVKGVGANLFAPDTALTVAEALTLAGRVLSLETGETALSDVGKDEWFYEPIAKIHSAGYIPDEIIRDNKIEPRRVITREEFAAVISKVTGEGDSAEYPFTDKDDISHWAKNYVYNTANKGIMIGDETSAFNPKGGLTRAEASVILLKLTEKI